MALRITSSFSAKAGAALALVAFGDWLFWAGEGIGSNLGLFALAWVVATLAVTRSSWRSPPALLAAGAAALGAVNLAISPSLLSFALFWSALSMAVLLPRFASFDHAGRWALRLAAHGVTSIVGPWRDLIRLRKHVGGRAQARAILPLLPLPLAGGAVFLALFASANPVIGDALARLSGPDTDLLSPGRLFFWGLLLMLVWAALRPRRVHIGMPSKTPVPAIELPGVSIGSVTLALLTFNALFAWQNVLDIAFLWSGAPLPGEMTLAEYAHRGAYPLIATALLAGLFVLVTLRPGSPTAAVPAIRKLVVLWIVQNVFLVASSILRTLDYVDAYSLTRLRIAALSWMLLVAVGLMLITWRMLRAKSAAWLINANAITTLTALVLCSIVDIGSVAAAWNVRHAREAGGRGAQLDLCYLNRLGPSALVSLVRLEQRRGLEPQFAERLRWVRHQLIAQTIAGQQGGWWTWRDARRLGEIRTMLGGTSLPAPPLPGPTGRACDGAPFPPTVVEEPPVAAPALTDQVENAAEPTATSDRSAALTNEAGQ